MARRARVPTVEGFIGGHSSPMPGEAPQREWDRPICFGSPCLGRGGDGPDPSRTLQVKGGRMVRPAGESPEIPAGPGPATFRQFVDVAPDAMVIVDRRGRIAYANAQVRPLLGYEPGELLGQSVEVLVPSRLR